MDPNWDVVIIGAGISGINAAHHLQQRLPHLRYTILESRSRVGGTWDLFRYPGIRSDTDLQSFGFGWNPWTENRAIADGASIARYLHDTAVQDGIYNRIEFNTRVHTANWSTKTQSWHLGITQDGTNVKLETRFMVLATGYYDYHEPLKPVIAGLDNPDFKGQVIHPQFWPEHLDYKDKHVVIVGSGATAITLLPAMSQLAASVTMVQRSPTYIMTLENQTGSSWIHRLVPRSWSFKISRVFFMCLTALTYYFCRAFPSRSRAMLTGAVARQLPAHVPLDPHFTPTYHPWDQRLCFTPDGDFFAALHSGKARVETGIIRGTTSDSVVLESGKTLRADIVVTATGLKLGLGGHVRFSVDGEPINLAERYAWRSALLQDVPNLAFMMGYVNASWTLGAEVTAELVCRLLGRMARKGETSVTPRVDKGSISPRPLWNLKATYVRESQKTMPVCGDVGVWRGRTNYFWDLWLARHGSISEGLEYVGR